MNSAPAADTLKRMYKVIEIPAAPATERRMISVSREARLALRQLRRHARDAEDAICQGALVEVGELAAAGPAEQAAGELERVVRRARLLGVDALVLPSKGFDTCHSQGDCALT